MVLPLDLLLEYGLSMLLSDSFMSNLYSQLYSSTGEYQALQLIVFVVFGALD